MEYEQMGADSALFNFATGGIKVDFARVVGELKPGAHLLALSPIATHHSNTIGIEDAGMEIRDTLSYVFDSGGNTPDLILVTVARKSLEGTVAENVLRWGTGGLNIDKCRVEHVTVDGGNLALNPHLRSHINGGNGGHIISTETERRVVKPHSEGRWPANVILQNCPLVKAFFPSGKSSHPTITKRSPDSGNRTGYGTFLGQPEVIIGYGDEGSAARFFYAAPCLNDLCSYLIRLVTPPDGTVLTNCDINNLPCHYKYLTNYEN